MTELFVARSKALSQWASDVGLGKQVFKLGLADQPAKALVEAAEWAGERDWVLMRKQPAEGLDEVALVEALAAREKRIDPALYPKLRGDLGIFRLTQARVENHIIIARALASASESIDIKLKPNDYADYLIAAALKAAAKSAPQE